MHAHSVGESWEPPESTATVPIPQLFTQLCARATGRACRTMVKERKHKPGQAAASSSRVAIRSKQKGPAPKPVARSDSARPGQIQKCDNCQALSSNTHWFGRQDVPDKKGGHNTVSVGSRCLNCGTIHKSAFSHLSWEEFCAQSGSELKEAVEAHNLCTYCLTSCPLHGGSGESIGRGGGKAQKTERLRLTWIL